MTHREELRQKENELLIRYELNYQANTARTAANNEGLKGATVLELTLEIAKIFESGRFAMMHRDGKFAGDKERWTYAANELPHRHIDLEATWNTYVKACLA